MIGDLFYNGSGCLRRRLAQSDVCSDLQEQVNTHKKFVPNVEQTCKKIKQPPKTDIKNNVIGLNKSRKSVSCGGTAGSED